MTLTLTNGPLAKAPGPTNYAIEGPKSRLFFDDFPRRVRAIFGGEVVLDSERGKLLHETGHLPQLYVLEDDLRADLLEPTEHRTHCPHKGDASYWSFRVADRVADNAVWAYLTPNDEASWLGGGYRGIYFEAMDAWFDEDEEIVGHLRDPYHRVDVRKSSRQVRVLVNGRVVADTRHAMILSETGLPNRYYIPRRDIDLAVLEPSAKHTVCPYKGTSSYYTLAVDGQRLNDAGWFYPEPLNDAARLGDHLCFLADGIELTVDGKPVE